MNCDVFGNFEPYQFQIELTYAVNHSAGRTRTISTCYWSKVPREIYVTPHFAPHLQSSCLERRGGKIELCF